jgi:hypothetical protein
MSDGTEDFEKLCKLLKLKNHEQPPPRYFNDFSTHILNRLEVEGRPGLMDRFWAQVPWLQRFLGLFEENPVAAGIFSVGVCGLLISGVTYSNYLDNLDSASLAFVPSPTGKSKVASSGRGLMASSQLPNPSTNPMLVSPNASGSPFDSFSGLSAQQVSYSTSAQQ